MKTKKFNVVMDGIIPLEATHGEIIPLTVRACEKWKKRRNTNDYYCGVCKDMFVTESEAFLFNYCPQCGADMRGEE